MESKLLVIYVGVAGIRSEDIEMYVHKVTKKITPQMFQGEVIIVPQQTFDTRIECIDPKYITDAQLITEHTEMMKKLQDELNYQFEKLKQERNEQ